MRTRELLATLASLRRVKVISPLLSAPPLRDLVPAPAWRRILDTPWSSSAVRSFRLMASVRAALAQAGAGLVFSNLPARSARARKDWESTHCFLRRAEYSAPPTRSSSMVARSLRSRGASRSETLTASSAGSCQSAGLPSARFAGFFSAFAGGKAEVEAVGAESSTK
jgi:hypothetical protein